MIFNLQLRRVGVGLDRSSYVGFIYEHQLTLHLPSQMRVDSIYKACVIYGFPIPFHLQKLRTMTIERTLKDNIDGDDEISSLTNGKNTSSTEYWPLLECHVNVM